MGLIKLKFKLITYWKIKSSKKITAFKNFTKQKKKKIKKIKKKIYYDCLHLILEYQKLTALLPVYT